MLNQHWQYDLAHHSPYGRHQPKPELVISIAACHQEELDRRLTVMHERWHQEAAAYCQSSDLKFFGLERDLFGGEFGYARCGYWQIFEGNLELHLPLTQNYQPTVFTLRSLFQTLRTPLSEHPTSNRTQLLELCTRADPTATGYGHAVGGYVASPVLSFLADQAAQRPCTEHGQATACAPVPTPIIIAMEETWKAVTHPDYWRWSDDIYGLMRQNGEFFLSCFGDRCDVGVYDRGLIDPTDQYQTLSCHNRERADQQLTLLSGLAKLCELAREH